MPKYLDARAIREQAEKYVQTNVRGGTRKHVAEVLINAYMSAKYPNLTGEKLKAKRHEIVSEAAYLFGKSTSDGNYDEFAITRFSVELARMKFSAQ